MAVEKRMKESVYRQRALLDFILEHPNQTTNFYWLWMRWTFRTTRRTFRGYMEPLGYFKLIEYDIPKEEKFNYWKWIVRPAPFPFIKNQLKWLKKLSEERDIGMFTISFDDVTHASVPLKG